MKKSLYSKNLYQFSIGNLNSIGLKGSSLNNRGNSAFRSENFLCEDSLTFQGKPQSSLNSTQEQKKYGFFHKRAQAILQPLFMKAISTQNQFWVEKLLKWGADPNVKDDYGCTPLALAFAQANLRIAKALLAANADPNCNGSDGHPLILSVFKEYHHIAVKTLLEAGANPNTQDFQGNTLLQLACQRRASSSTLQRLLDYGADPNLIPKGKDSPLRMVLKEGLLEQTEVLLRAGAKFQEPLEALPPTQVPLPILAMCAIKQENNP
ncbi:MAG: ankyrin repeat domain-containing protein, partial [Cyanobacteria bacterium]|nr:ankyrin repeat domain-containing protein [Cyanobacteriota bacterium]